MFTDRLCNEGAHNHELSVGQKWHTRFGARIPDERYWRAHTEAFRALAGAHRRRPVRVDIQI
eukprot:13395618-Alexandrium_andersonii.AAC.1